MWLRSGLIQGSRSNGSISYAGVTSNSSTISQECKKELPASGWRKRGGGGSKYLFAALGYKERTSLIYSLMLSPDVSVTVMYVVG